MWDGINRRRFIRTEFPFTIHIYIFQRPAISTYTEDISEAGVKVTLREEIPPAAIVDLEIYMQIEPVVCKGRIAWVKRRESKYLQNITLFDTGIELLQIKEADRKLLRKCVEELKQEKDST